MKKWIAMVLALVLTMLSCAMAETVEGTDGEQLAACPAYAAYAIAVGDTLEMSLAEMENAETAVWSSSDESIASVDASGTVTALNVGEVLITALLGENEVQFDVQVMEGEALEAAQQEEAFVGLSIALGENMEMSVPEIEAESVEIEWTSSDENIASVDANGTVTALNAGEAEITAAITATRTVTVEKTVTETVEETDPVTGETSSKEVEKTISEEEEQVENSEIEYAVRVEAAQCPGCGVEYLNAEEYKAHVQIAVCGAEGHYICDGRDHETILDEFCQNENPHRICQAGEASHVCDSCGATYACEDSGSHAICLACGNAWCYKDEGNHVTPACGKIEHRPCVQDDYHKSEHYRCKYCNQRRCNGKKHGLGKCVAAVETPVE